MVRQGDEWNCKVLKMGNEVFVDNETALEYLIIRLFYIEMIIYNDYISKGLRFKRTGRIR